MNNDKDEVINDLDKRKKILWPCILFFGLCGIVGLANIETIEDILYTALSFAFVGIGIWGLRRLDKFKYSMNMYVIGKGFKYYRKTAEQKVKNLTYGEVSIVILFIICLKFGLPVGQLIIYGLSSIVAIELLVKKRIKLHTIIDDATLFELEEREIIKSEEVVKSLYKDFESWNEVKKGSRILVLTMDKLIGITIQSESEFKRIYCSLNRINRLGIIGNGNNQHGLIISIGTIDNDYFRVKLDGESFQDSPEEFISIFLNSLDEVLSRNTKINNTNINFTNNVSTNESYGINDNEIKNTELDFEYVEKNNIKNEDTNQNVRYIDL